MPGQAAGTLACLLLLAGCGGDVSLDQPVDWWHQLQGGVIADERPPPPGVADPYPNLGMIPPKPTPTDPVTRRTLLARLAAQRDRTEQEVKQEPIVWPVPGAPSPPAPTPAPTPAQGAPQATPPATPVATPAATPAATAAAAGQAAAAAPSADPGIQASLDAATPAPAPVVAPRPAPAPPPPAAFTAPPRHAQPAQTGQTPAAPVVSGPVPALPTAAPPLPQLAGIPAATFAPATPRPAPSTRFDFARGSDAVPPEAEQALRALAARRSGATIAIATGGDAASAAPDAQAAALPLALRRAGAISAALIGAGVPPTALRTDAAAQGRDGSARLVN